MHVGDDFGLQSLLRSKRVGAAFVLMSRMMIFGRLFPN